MAEQKMAKMAVLKGPNQIDIEKYPLPEVREDGMLIKIEAACICGSDAHSIKTTPEEPSPLGHEFSGRIVAMGSRAHETIYSFTGSLKEGDRIAVYPWITCGTCPDCMRNGNGVCMICENGFCYGGTETMGTSKFTAAVAEEPHFKGGFAEYLYINPGTFVWQLPDDMPSEVAALLDPLAVCARAIEMAQTEPGVLGESLNTNTNAVVIGEGAIGIMTAMLLKIQGCRNVILTGHKDEKLKVAQEISDCDYIINSNSMSKEELRNYICEITGGGPDLVIQCANNTMASIEGLEMVRKLGTFIEVGVPFGFGDKFEVDIPQVFFSKNVKINSLTSNSQRVFDKAFRLLERHQKYPFHKLLTHKFYDLEDLMPTMEKMKDVDYIKGVMILK
ncbi:MAG: zinc-binding dehydrogenase [Suipraeoptans sp.]